MNSTISLTNRTGQLISLQEAADILGYKSIQFIIYFITNGYLKVHYSHRTIKESVSLNEVLKLETKLRKKQVCLYRKSR